MPIGKQDNENCPKKRAKKACPLEDFSQAISFKNANPAKKARGVSNTYLSKKNGV